MGNCWKTDSIAKIAEMFAKAYIFKYKYCLLVVPSVFEEA